jgi:hypothetical protein
MELKKKIIKKFEDLKLNDIVLVIRNRIGTDMGTVEKITCIDGDKFWAKRIVSTGDQETPIMLCEDKYLKRTFENEEYTTILIGRGNDQ